MKYFILFTITLFSLNSFANDGETPVKLSSDCRRIVSKASEVNPAELSPVVQLALSSCSEMPNRASVQTAIQAVQNASPNIKLKLLNQLSARMVVFIESKQCRTEIENIADGKMSCFVWYSGIQPLRADINRAADLLGIEGFSYHELYEFPNFGRNQEPNIYKTYQRLGRFLYDHVFYQ